MSNFIFFPPFRDIRTNIRPPRVPSSAARRKTSPFDRQIARLTRPLPSTDRPRPVANHALEARSPRPFRITRLVLGFRQAKRQYCERILHINLQISYYYLQPGTLWRNMSCIQIIC